MNTGFVTYTYVIPKRIKSVHMVKDMDTTTGMECIYFTYYDNSKSSASPVTTCTSDTPSYSVSFCYNFIGMDCNVCSNGTKVISAFGICPIAYDDIGYYQWFRKIANFQLGVGAAAVVYNPETTALGCWAETWTKSCKLNGVSTPCPTGFVLTSPVQASNPGYGTFSFYTNSNADRGVWTVTMQGTYNSIVAGPWSFDVTVVTLCETTVIDSPTAKTINNMTVYVGQGSVTQDTTMTNSVSVAQSNPAFCDGYTVTWSVSLPSFMSYTYPTITLLSTSPNDLITYPSPVSLTMTFKLTGYPAITAVTKTFTVQVLCQVQTLAFATTPLATKTVRVGIDSQPVD